MADSQKTRQGHIWWTAAEKMHHAFNGGWARDGDE